MGSAILAWLAKQGIGIILGALSKLLLDYVAERRADQAPSAPGSSKSQTRSTFKPWRFRMRWRACLALPMMLWLGVCNPESSEVVVKIVCPVITQYDEKTQEQALAEYNALPKDSRLRLFIGDYKRLRDQITVCRERGGAAVAKAPK
jgi:hypothetical protein